MRHLAAKAPTLLAGVKSYASSPTNWADCALVLVVLLLPPVMLLDSAVARPLAALGTMLVVLKGQKAMRGDEKMSFLVTMLVAIITDMQALLLLLVLFICSFAFMLALLLQAQEPYDEPVLALFTSYGLLMHGEGFGEAGLYASSPLTTTIFLYHTVMLNIVMLNALIAIMGDTYDRVSETRTERGLLQRAALLAELEASMDKDDEVCAAEGLARPVGKGCGSIMHAQHTFFCDRSSSRAGCTPSAATPTRRRMRSRRSGQGGCVRCRRRLPRSRRASRRPSLGSKARWPP